VLSGLCCGEGEPVGVGDVEDVRELSQRRAVPVALDVWCEARRDGERFRDDSRLVGVAVRTGCSGDGEASKRDGAERAGCRLVAMSCSAASLVHRHISTAT
jgi:hypothetical protein